MPPVEQAAKAMCEWDVVYIPDCDTPKEPAFMRTAQKWEDASDDLKDLWISRAWRAFEVFSQ